VLQVLFFAVLFGVSLALVGEEGAQVTLPHRRRFDVLFRAMGSWGGACSLWALSAWVTSALASSVEGSMLSRARGRR